MDGALKKQIIVAVEPVFLYPLVEQLTGFVHVLALNMLQHLFLGYGTIETIDLEGKSVKMMVPCNPAEPLV